MRRLLKHAFLVVALIGAGLFALPASPASAGYWQQEVGIRNQDGRAEYFSIDSTRHLIHQWEQTPYQGDFVPWRRLSGILSSGIGVILNDNGTIGVFGRAEGGDLDYVQQLSPGGDWSGWTSFAGRIELHSEVTAGVWASDTCTVGGFHIPCHERNYVKVIGTDGAPHYKYQYCVNGCWSPNWE
ncbi:hypothetical protein DFJ67_1934 [Asanoa ferruginea]|uniref:PLL-like beta propeller domain-containing protein n=1 Tax=Asanoa ferruginea TaxID=53367 RepID=A0A3D9ZGI7_9ACTN|nr:hypothetical protein [Asanoa ferruginea]REF95969.1 hypothetical protein DFJ67_1934 [Asanoa ferruginea]GIF48172.1 hypothetical protein Afe04nite_27110 [Asanoa ferruginea]